MGFLSLYQICPVGFWLIRPVGEEGAILILKDLLCPLIETLFRFKSAAVLWYDTPITLPSPARGRWFKLLLFLFNLLTTMNLHPLTDLVLVLILEWEWKRIAVVSRKRAYYGFAAHPPVLLPLPLKVFVMKECPPSTSIAHRDFPLSSTCMFKDMRLLVIFF